MNVSINDVVEALRKHYGKDLHIKSICVNGIEHNAWGVPINFEVEEI